VVGRTYLFDANAIIEAVRVGVWNALTGGLLLHTVETCADECRRGDRFSTGYVAVTEAALDRITAIRWVADDHIASVLLMDKAEALDPGELELFAHALALPSDDVWVICSPDLASVKFAVAAGIGERLISLEEAMNVVGTNARTPLRNHFTATWLSAERTKAMLGVR
jgi:hypothetical protein